MAATTPRPRRRRRAVKWGSGGLRPEMTLPVEIYSERRIRGFDEAELARVLSPRRMCPNLAQAVHLSERLGVIAVQRPRSERLG